MYQSRRFLSTLSIAFALTLGAAFTAQASTTHYLMERAGYDIAHSLTRSAYDHYKGRSTATSYRTNSEERPTWRPHVGLGKCTGLLFHGQKPAFTNPAYSKDFTVLCFQTFVVGYSGLTRTPLWSAEILTANSVAAARKMHRDNVFHPEGALPASWQATLGDYVHSGYDRGHLSPDGDMPDALAQHQSFSLANIAPQAPQLNRGPWAELESKVRNEAADGHNLYVITGVLFTSNNLNWLKSQVAIPNDYYKVVYDPAQHLAGAWVANNVQSGRPEEMPVATFEARYGIHYGFGNAGLLKLPRAARGSYH